MWFGEEYLVLFAQADLDTINFLVHKIKQLEEAIRKKSNSDKHFIS